MKSYIIEIIAVVGLTSTALIYAWKGMDSAIFGALAAAVSAIATRRYYKRKMEGGEH